MFKNLKRCHIDTICLGIVFTVGVYIVHKKIKEDYKNFSKMEQLKRLNTIN